MAKKKAKASNSSNPTRKKSESKEELAPARGSAQPRDMGLPGGYGPVLAELKARVRLAQLKAAVAVNPELILLSWHIGREIRHCQNERSILATQIETEAHERAGRAITNFDRSLPPEQSDRAHEVLNDLQQELR